MDWRLAAGVLFGALALLVLINTLRNIEKPHPRIKRRLDL